MSFTKSFAVAVKKMENPKTSHNQLFLIGILENGKEEIICKVEPTTTMGELNFDPSSYKAVRVMAGTVAKGVK